MDRSFANCLAEIEKSYLVLPKAARIRVERWVEKLVSTGNNPTWKKHRNDYARLLLNMVIARNLEAPFNVMPPESPLAPFSSQFKSFNKNLLGPHESSFWRELYKHLGDHHSENDEEEKGGEGENSYNKLDRNGEFLAPKFHNQSRPVASSGANQVVLSREIQSLNLLIREQGQRIKLLEQQLHDERSQHELQIQRLNYSHRVEANNLKKQIEDFAVELSVQELSPSRRATSQYINNTIDSLGHGSMYDSHYAVRLGPSFDNHQNIPRPPLSPTRSYGSPLRQPLPESTGRHGMMSFLEQKNIISSTLNGLSVMEPDSFDLSPRPKVASHTQQQPQTMRSMQPNTFTASADNTFAAAAAATTAADDSRFGTPGGMDSSLHWGTRLHSAVGDQEDEEFLAHIDRFQSEIKKINTNITLTSPERF